MKPDEPRDFPAYRARLLEEQRCGVGLPWNVPGGLRLKVALDGRMLPFYGDTVVFRLPASPWLEELRARLVTGLEGLFAEPLEEFHLTLHDLSNGPSPDVPSHLEAFERIPLEPGCVDVEAISVFPCLNISVLVGFAPVTAKDYAKLMAWHRAYDPIVELSYWFRPHVTLAYFRPREYTRSEVQTLNARLGELQAEGRFTLDAEEVVYQRFTSMNHYRDVARPRLRS